MSEEDANVAMLKEAYAAWHETKGDAEVLYGLLADEIAWGSLGDGKPGMEFTGRRTSKTEVIDYFEGLNRDWSMQFFHAKEFIAQDNRVVVLSDVSWTNRKTGKTATMPKADAWWFRDGKAVEFMEFYDTHKALCACQSD